MDMIEQKIIEFIKKKQALMYIIFLVSCMFVVAQVSGEEEIIFPEIAALGVGAWFIKESPWEKKPLYLWLSPTLASVTGIAILRYAPIAKEFMIIVAFVLVIVELKVLHSKVLPSISAAILPIIMDSESIYYVISVSILTAIIALGSILIKRYQSLQNSSDVLSDTMQEALLQTKQSMLLHWTKLYISIAIFAMVAVRTRCMFIVAPPLIVTFVELSEKNNDINKKPMQLLGIMTSGAVCGALIVYLMYIICNLPLFIVSPVITMCVFALFRVFKITFPPVAAISLLPTIISPNLLLYYPIEIVIGTVIFILLGKFVSARKVFKFTEDGISC